MADLARSRAVYTRALEPLGSREIFAADSREQIDAFHAAALAAGGG